MMFGLSDVIQRLSIDVVWVCFSEMLFLGDRGLQYHYVEVIFAARFSTLAFSTMLLVVAICHVFSLSDGSV